MKSDCDAQTFIVYNWKSVISNGLMFLTQKPFMRFDMVSIKLAKFCSSLPLLMKI